MSRLVRNNLIVASGTAVSRVTGMARTAAIAAVLGRDLLSDAYVLANDTPNIVYDLIIGGVLSATLVPLFTTYLAPRPGGSGPRARSSPGDALSPPRTRAEAERGTNVIITVAIVLIAVLTVVAIVAAPLIIRLYTLTPPDDIDAGVYRAAGTALARVFLVQILFYGLTGLANAFLNSRRRFAAAAWSPVAANLITIAALFSLPGAGTRTWAVGEVLTDGRLRWTLGLGATLGIATMGIIVVVAARRAGLRYRPVWDLQHPAVRKLMHLSTWTFGFVAANQVAVVVIKNLLGYIGPGNVSAYTYAFMFFLLPHGLLAVSISTTFQPELARAVNEGDQVRFARQVGLGVRTIIALTLPASVIMLALPQSVMGLLERAQFTADDVASASKALAGFAAGLAAFSVYQFTLRGFYAFHNSKTPFMINVGENVLNIVVGLSLLGPLGLFGLSFSYGFAYMVSAVVALVVLRRYAPQIDLFEIGVSALRLTGAALVMGAVVYALSAVLPTGGGAAALFTLSVATLVGFAVYIGALLIAGADEVSALRRLVRSS